jgi:hypothetical protein
MRNALRQIGQLSVGAGIGRRNSPPSAAPNSHSGSEATCAADAPRVSGGDVEPPSPAAVAAAADAAAAELTDRCSVSSSVRAMVAIWSARASTDAMEADSAAACVNAE